MHAHANNYLNLNTGQVVTSQQTAARAAMGLRERLVSEFE